FDGQPLREKTFRLGVVAERPLQVGEREKGLGHGETLGLFDAAGDGEGFLVERLDPGRVPGRDALFGESLAERVEGPGHGEVPVSLLAPPDGKGFPQESFRTGEIETLVAQRREMLETLRRFQGAGTEDPAA